MNNTMIKGLELYFNQNGIKVHKATDTHLYLIVPREHNPADGWKQRMLEFTRKTWNLGLKIKTI